jgi:hypothetical protein
MSKAGARNKYNHLNPDKVKAHRAVINLKCSPNCFKHHWSFNFKDYTNIIELDRKYLNFIRAHLVYDHTTKYYKDLKGNLLDTKDKHRKYLDEKISKFELYLELNKKTAKGNRKRIKV